MNADWIVVLYGSKLRDGSWVGNAAHAGEFDVAQSGNGECAACDFVSQKRQML